MIVNGVRGVVMQQILGKDGRPAHMAFSMGHANAGRTDLAHAGEGLQVAVIRFPAGKHFQAHKHLSRPRTIPITQEAWVVVSGIVKVDYFDDDGTFLADCILSAGDMSLTFRGGHGYKIVEDAEVYEFKLGPFSFVNDKEYFG